MKHLTRLQAAKMKRLKMEGNYSEPYAPAQDVVDPDPNRPPDIILLSGKKFDGVERGGREDGRGIPKEEIGQMSAMIAQNPSKF